PPTTAPPAPAETRRSHDPAEYSTRTHPNSAAGPNTSETFAMAPPKPADQQGHHPTGGPRSPPRPHPARSPSPTAPRNRPAARPSARPLRDSTKINAEHPGDTPAVLTSMTYMSPRCHRR